MEFINGVKVTNLEAIEAAGMDRKALAEATLRSLSKQLFIDGFFHADPHPGNVFVNLDTGDLTFIDLGMTGEEADKEIIVNRLVDCGNDQSIRKFTPPVANNNRF